MLATIVLGVEAEVKGDNEGLWAPLLRLPSPPVGQPLQVPFILVLAKVVVPGDRPYIIALFLQPLTAHATVRHTRMTGPVGVMSPKEASRKTPRNLSLGFQCPALLDMRQVQ